MTAPEIGKPEDYIRVLDRGGYFEVTSLSEDDRKRNEMYQANLKREKAQASFKNGVLTIKLPQTPEAQAKIKRIDVKNG